MVLRLEQLRYAKEDAYRNETVPCKSRPGTLWQRRLEQLKEDILEKRFSANNPALVWRSLQYSTNHRRPSPPVEANKGLADELNTFYWRFEKDFSTHTLPTACPITALPCAYCINWLQPSQISLTESCSKFPPALNTLPSPPQEALLHRNEWLQASYSDTDHHEVFGQVGQWMA